MHAADQVGKTFGGDTAYYARTASGALLSSARADLLKRLLDEIDPKFRERVELAMKDWNQADREALRTQTGLRMTLGDERQVVKVTVRDGLPVPLENLTAKFPDPIQWQLILHQQDLAAGVRSIGVLRKNLEAVNSWLDAVPSPERARNLYGAENLLQTILQRLEQNPLLQELYAIEADVLGAYHFKLTIPAVTLHWMVIGLVASNLGLSVEALTVVTLTHELAHAYTHVGRDTDGEIWPTVGFAGSNLTVVEGLAQYYTEAVMNRFAPRFPEGLRAFNVLLKKQPPPYTQYMKWFSPESRHGEVLRACLIDSRQKGQVTLPDFDSLLAERHKRFRGRSKAKLTDHFL